MGESESCCHPSKNVSIPKALPFLVKISEVHMDEIEFLKDKMLQVSHQDMKLPLHNCIGPLLLSKPYSSGIEGGSALLISPNLILTAAHNLYDVQKKQCFSHFRFFPGQQGALRRYCTAYEVYVPEAYKKKRESINDYALLKLQQKIDASSFIPLCASIKKLKKEINSVKLALFGYPAEYFKQDKISSTISIGQWGLIRDHKIKIINEEEKTILHQISAAKGSSGAPLILIDKKQHLAVVGISIGGVRNNQGDYNVARLLTPELIQQLRVETMKLGAVMFQIEQQQQGQFLQQQRQEEKITDPSMAISYLNQGVIFFQKKQFGEAMKSFRKSLEIDPHNFEACSNIANMLKDLNRNEQSVEYYQKAIEMNPMDKQIFFNFGNALSSLKKKEEAIELYKKAIEIDPEFTLAYNNIGCALKDLDRKEEAIEYFKKIIQIDPTYSSAYFNIGYTLYDLNSYQQAIEYFNKAIQLNPKDSQAYVNLGDALQNLQRKSEAIEFYMNATEYGPKSAITYFGLGNILKQLNRKQQAIDYYKKAIRMDANFPQPYNYIGIILIELNRRKQAIEYFKKAIEIDPKFKEAYNNLGNMLYRVNQKQESMKYFKKLIEIDPEDAAAHTSLGCSLCDLSQKQEAMEHFKKAININPQYSPAYAYCLVISQDIKHIKETLKFCEHVLVEHPNCPEAMSACNDLKNKLYKLIND